MFSIEFTFSSAFSPSNHFVLLLVLLNSSPYTLSNLFTPSGPFSPSGSFSPSSFFTPIRTNVLDPENFFDERKNVSIFSKEEM